ncbi:MAG TPA: formate dehydrogenase accessory protein FdhE [Vicinamibacterales bacterium]
MLDTERRVDTRVLLPRTFGKDDLFARRLAAGLRLLEFDELSLEWSDFRRLLGQGGDLLRQFQMIEEQDAARLQALLRDATALPIEVRRWYDLQPDADAALAQAFLIGSRPYLARAAAVLLPRVDMSGVVRRRCPVCAGEPELAAWSAEGRRLICARCTAQWPFPGELCPFCEQGDAGSRKTFASQTRVYRVDACGICRRYLKGIDEPRAGRAVLPAFDTIATIPLDAAAVQLGYE